MPMVPNGPDEALEALADHCLAAHALIGEHGSPMMQRLIDLLLFEIGVASASQIEDEAHKGVERKGHA